MIEQNDALWVSLPVPALLLDGRDRIVQINPAAEGFLMTSSKAIAGQPVWDKLMVDAPLRVDTQLLAHDAKRLHYMHFMYHAEDGYLASTNELVSLHVSMETRRSAPMPGDVLGRLDQIAALHDTMPRPEQAGRVISIVR